MERQVEEQRGLSRTVSKDKTVTDGNVFLSLKFVRSLKLSHFLRLRNKNKTKMYCYVSIMLYDELKYHFFKKLVVF